MKTLFLKFAAVFTSCLLMLSFAPTLAFASTNGVQKVTDPDTSSSWRALFDIQSSSDADYSYSTQESGRIWVDKSVYTDEASAESSGIPALSMSNPENDFLVGLSTLSASSTIQKESPFSHDVVFIVSLNSSMASLNYDGKPYAAYIADALNESISRLMNENTKAGSQTKTRVAVIGYSVDVTTLMPLDSYQPDKNGNYIVFSDSLEGGAGLQPVCTPNSPDTQTQSETVRGSAYLQRAITEASNALQNGADSATEDQPRKPELVIMGASVPLMANTNIASPPVYTNESAEEDGFVGSMPANHNSVGFGTDAALATLLTLQNESLAINNSYEQKNGTSLRDTSLDVWTVGLNTSGMSAYVLQTAQEQATANVSDAAGTETVNLTDNIKNARSKYAQAAASNEQSVDLDLYGSGTGGIKSETISFPQPINGLLSSDNNYSFNGASDYYLATDAGALPGGFNAAVDRILGIQYNSPVNEGEGTAADSSDRLRIQDTIGTLMNIKRMDGILYQGNLLDGSKAAQAVSASFADPWDVESYHEVDCIMDSLNERYNLGWDAYSLLYDAYNDGQFAYRGAGDYSNYVSWYVDSSHNMIKTGNSGYTFASNEVITAAETGDWQNNSSDTTKADIEKAIASGATAVCQTYFYIGNIESQYTGDDVPLYDFVVMVETNLDTGNQQLLLTIPADSIPARKAYVTEHLDDSASMTLDADAETTLPLRLIYEVGPRENVNNLIDRLSSGEDISSDEIETALGSSIKQNASGQYLLYTNEFSGEGTSSTAETIMTAVAASTNSYYSFTQDTPLYTLKSGVSLSGDQIPSEDQIVPLTTAPEAGKTYYYLHTYYQAKDLAFGVEVPAEAVTAVEPHTTANSKSFNSENYYQSNDGSYIVKAGTPKYIVSSMLEDYAKNPNATNSAPYVKQISISDYTSLNRPLVSARLGNNGTFVITPAQKTGSLTIEKHLKTNSDHLPLLQSDLDRSFAFQVAFSDKAGNALSGTVSLSTNNSSSQMLSLENGGLANLSLKDGESATFENLPEGTRYTIKELDYSGFEPSFTITSNNNEVSSEASNETSQQSIVEGSSTVSFTNTKQGGSLVVSKQVSGNASDPSKSFPFEIKITDNNNNPIQGQFAYGLFSGSDPKNWNSWSLGTAATNEQGILSLENGTVSLAQGQSIALSGLPLGSKYEVVEAENDGYTTNISKTTGTETEKIPSSSCSGGIQDNNQIDVLTFTNEKWAYGALQITKYAYGVEENASFSFTVTLQDAQGNPLSGSYQVTTSNGDSPQTNEMTLDENGALHLPLSNSQTAKIEGIPQGSQYQVTEQNIGSNYLVLSNDAEGIIGDKIASASFTNIKQTGALGIVNIINGNAADMATECSYTITVDGIFADGSTEPKTITAYKYDSDGKQGPINIIFDRNGEGSAGVAHIDSIKGNEGILINSLPSSASFSVTETNADALKNNGYTVSSGIGNDSKQDTAIVQGYLQSDAVTTAWFLNEKNEYGSLKINKRISGNAAIDEAAQGRTFSFAITAADSRGLPLVGNFVAVNEKGDSTSVTFENGIASVNLTAPLSVNDSSTITISGLPTGTKYKVTEQSLSDSGYESSSANTEGVIGSDPSNPNEVQFTNEKSYSSFSMPITGLEVLKGKSSNAGDFIFQLFESDGTTPVLDVDKNPITSANRASAAGVPTSFVLNGLQIKKPGDYQYIVKESSGTAEPIEGVAYDQTVYTVNISAKASATGKLSLASLSYTVDSRPVFGISFVNEYRSATGSFILKAHKELSGSALENDDFAFYAQEVDPGSLTPIGAPLVARNSSDGTIEFPSLSETTPVGGKNTRTFILSESLPPSANIDNSFTSAGISYDTTQYLVTVSGQSKNNSSTLTFNAITSKRTLDENGNYGPWEQANGVGGLIDDETVPTFLNSLNNSQTTTAFEGKIHYLDETGSNPLKDNMFHFSITAVGQNSNSAPLPSVEQVSNTGSTFSFGPINIPYDNNLVDQTFTYEIRQTIPEGAHYSNDGKFATLNGMKYDARTVTISMKLVPQTNDDGLQTLKANITYLDSEGSPIQAIEFFNVFQDESGVSVPTDSGSNDGLNTDIDALARTGDTTNIVPLIIAALLATTTLMVARYRLRKK